MRIPVYQVTVHEYIVKKLKEDGKYSTIEYFWKPMRIPRVYDVKKPNFKKIG